MHLRNGENEGTHKQPIKDRETTDEPAEEPDFPTTECTRENRIFRQEKKGKSRLRGGRGLVI